MQKRLVCEEMKDRIFTYITETDLKKIEYKKIQNNPSMRLHCYFGTTKSYNAEVKAINYNSIEDFIRSIIVQIPMANRDNKKIRYNFANFFTQYTINSTEIERDNKEENLWISKLLPNEKYTFSIKFKEHDAIIKLPDLLLDNLIKKKQTLVD